MDQPELEARLLPCVGDKSIPIALKVSCFGTDIELFRYSNSSVKDLMAEVASIAGLEPADLKLNVIEEEMRSRRIDTPLYTKESMTLPEQLR